MGLGNKNDYFSNARKNNLFKIKRSCLKSNVIDNCREEEKTVSFDFQFVNSYRLSFLPAKISF